MADDNGFTYDDKLNFIASLYCPARQISDEQGCSWELILAQAAQETGWGAHVLPGTHNVFNIKADSSWHGEKHTFTVEEQREDGSKYWVTAPFRVYPSVLESLRDRQKFLADNPRYSGLNRDGIKGNATKEAQYLQEAHYASDKHYAANIMDVANGPSMKRAIARAKAAGCKGCLPTVNVYVLDQAKAHMVNTKIKATQGDKSIDLFTDLNGQVQVQAALSGGPVTLQAWSEHDHTWVQVDKTVTPTTPATAVTVIAPTLVVPTATEIHTPPPAPAQPPANHPAVQHPTHTAHTATTAASHAGTETYTVHKGDTLSKIAKKHSTSYRVLAHLNGIASPYFLYPGQMLKVPKAHHAHGPSGSAVKAAPTADAPVAVTDATAATAPASASAASTAATSASTAAAAPATPSAASTGSSASTTHAGQTASTASATSAAAQHPHQPAAPAAVHAIRSRDESDQPKTEALSTQHAPWMAYAEAERRVGIKRKGGAVSTEHIVEYFGATSQTKANPNTTAYCAAFVNWCLQRAGYEGTKGKTNALATSFLKWGKPTKGNKPAYGAIAVVRFGPSSHHVTFVNGAHSLDANGHLGYLATLGGNQGAAHEVSKSHLVPSKVIAYRFPAGYQETEEDYKLALVSDEGSTTMTAASTH